MRHCCNVSFGYDVSSHAAAGSLACFSHGVSFNRRLACIRDKLGVYQLIFIKTAYEHGETVDVRVRACVPEAAGFKCST